jgi:hypothetical protein
MRRTLSASGFPREKMAAAEKEGYDGHELAIALMDCATKDGGMRG